MGFGNVAGRLHLVTAQDTAVDVNTSSRGKFPAEPSVPEPRQIFAIGLNESTFSVPDELTVLTKFQTGLTGPTPDEVPDHAANGRSMLEERPNIRIRSFRIFRRRSGGRGATIVTSPFEAERRIPA